MEEGWEQGFIIVLINYKKARHDNFLEYFYGVHLLKKLTLKFVFIEK